MKETMMKETIVKFVKGPFPKKYTAYIKNKKTPFWRQTVSAIQR